MKSVMQEDLLYHLLQEHISAASETTASHGDLIKKVASAYFQHLQSQGHVPYQMIQVVIEDLEVELLDMYRKKTYGSYSLSSYRLESRTKRKG